MLLPLTLAAVFGLAAAAWHAKRSLARSTAAKTASTSEASEGLEQEVAAPALSAGSSGPVGDLLKQVVGSAGIVGVGLAVAELGANLVGAACGSELEKNLARVGGPAVAAPILLKEGVGAVLGELGVKNEKVKEGVGQGVAVAVFAAPLLPLFGAVKLGEGLVDLFGDNDEEAVPPPWLFNQILSEGELRKVLFNPRDLLRVTSKRRGTWRLAHLKAGTHVVRLRVSGNDLWAEAPMLRLLVDGQPVSPDVPAVAPRHRGLWQELFFRVTLNGADTIGLGLLNAQLNPSEGNRELWVDWMQVGETRYLPSEGYYYRYDGSGAQLDTIPGQPGMHWTGVLAWRLKPEHRGTGFPLISPIRDVFQVDYAAAESSLNLIY